MLQCNEPIWAQLECKLRLSTLGILNVKGKPCVDSLPKRPGAPPYRDQAAFDVIGTLANEAARMRLVAHWYRVWASGLVCRQCLLELRCLTSEGLHQ
jgi:hypothetical protein